MKDSIYADWNPWHGCTKISPGCKFCYVYRQDEMYGNPTASSRCTKNAAFDLPVQRGRGGSYKIPPGRIILTCFTSDFLLKDARPLAAGLLAHDAGALRLLVLLFHEAHRPSRRVPPAGLGRGLRQRYDRLHRRKSGARRLPAAIFLSLPIKHRSVIVAPMLERVDLSKWLGSGIEEVSAGGESGAHARPCDYAWILDLRRQCVENNVPFSFHQTGAHFIKDGRLYNIERKFQKAQARKAGIDFRIGRERYSRDRIIPRAVRPSAAAGIHPRR